MTAEEEGALYVGCSGGRDTTGTWNTEAEEFSRKYFRYAIESIRVKGRTFGLEIDKGRGNAIKIRMRSCKLSALGERLSTINEGNKRNAIPRECDALLFVPKNL